MEMNKNKKIIVTHDSKFHTDDVFACATILLVLEKNNETFELFRTRDESIIKTGDYVFDIGGIYDESLNRFDHHQIGGAGKRENGIEYASFGLVWKKFGIILCESEDVVSKIDKKMAQPIDAIDNGIDIYTSVIKDVQPYGIDSIVSAFLPTWNEKENNKDEIFLEVVFLAKKILQREIIKAKQKESDKNILIDIYKKAEDKRIMILDQHYSGKDVFSDFPEPLYVIDQREDGDWMLTTVRKEKHSFVNRKDLPVAWAGLRNEELQKVTGVSDAVFCHRSLFLGVAKTKEGIMKLVELALNN